MNVFQDTLRRIAERVEGTRAVSLVGTDGIAIDSYVSAEGLPMDSLAAESGSLVKAARAARALAEHGPIQQLTVASDRAATILCRVTEEYYLVLLLARDGNFGRGRFELHKAAVALEKELL
ncbi:MAG TPA: roadblock/LC7 domain-containing protein [Thermoanaerobaculia bacterium]|jgi:predicted regulator of Ras-like GTPase activity (Roadblock/LC7/MglB family)|nr:roadblock/LC7 domain-containing protein [Thermoanaerobaculia bacterium]